LTIDVLNIYKDMLRNMFLLLLYSKHKINMFFFIFAFSLTSIENASFVSCLL